MGKSSSEIDSCLDQVDPYEFEKLVADIWDNLGFETSVTKKSNDRGIDVEAIQKYPTEKKALIQAKAYSKGNKIGSGEIRKYATLYQQEDDADQVVIVSTSSYTSEAKQLADDLDVAIKNRSDVITLIKKSETHIDLPSSAQPPNYESSDTVDGHSDSSRPSTHRNPDIRGQANKAGSADNTQSDSSTHTDRIVWKTMQTLVFCFMIASILFSIYIYFAGAASVGETEQFGEYTLRVENIYTSDTIQTRDGTYEVSDISSFNLEEAESSDAEQFLIIVINFEETPDSSNLYQPEISINENRYALSITNDIYINDRELEPFHLSERSQGQEAIIFAIPDKNMSGKNLRMSADHSSDFAWWEISNVSDL